LSIVSIKTMMLHWSSLSPCLFAQAAAAERQFHFIDRSRTARRHSVDSPGGGRNLPGLAVPIRVLLHGDVWFEPEDIEKLAAAFELALSKLELRDRQDPLAVVLAKFIIELAKEGERDPDKLCDGALKILRK